MCKTLLKNTYAAIVALFIAMMALPQQAQAQNYITIDGVQKKIRRTIFKPTPDDRDLFTVFLFLDNDGYDVVSITGSKKWHATYNFVYLDRYEEEHDVGNYWEVSYSKNATTIFSAYGNPYAKWTLFTTGHMTIYGDPCNSHGLCGISLYGKITDRKKGDGKEHTISIDYKYERKEPRVGRLTVGSINETSVSLFWTHGSDNVTPKNKLFYNVEYQEEGADSWYMPPVGNATSYTITGLKPDTKYNVNILVMDQSGNYTRYGQQQVRTKKAIDYGFAIAGTRINSANYTSLSKLPGVSGTVKYDPNSKTLTLENAYIINSKGEGCGLANYIGDLTIHLIGNNTITSQEGGGIYNAYTLTFTGNGKLTVQGSPTSSNGEYGIYNQGYITVSDCTLEVSGREYGLTDGHWRFERCTVLAKGGGNNEEEYAGSICNIWDEKPDLIGCDITAPTGAYWKDFIGVDTKTCYSLVGANGKVITDWVTIKPVTLCGFQVCGRIINSENCKNLLAITPEAQGSQGSKFCYDPESKTLYLWNVSIDLKKGAYPVIYSKVDGLTISSQNCHIKSSGDAIELFRDTKIVGDQLYVKSGSGCGIYVYDSHLSIMNRLMEVKGRWGIAGDSNKKSKLTIDEGIVSAKGLDGSISDFTSLILKGCEITRPIGAKFDPSMYCIALNGKKVTDEVKIEPVINYNLCIAGHWVTSANCNDLTVIPGVSGTVSYDHNDRVLTLKNATINPEGSYLGLQAENSMTVKVIGTNNITSCHNYHPTFQLKDRLKITGGGILNVTSQKASAINAYQTTLTIENCTVNAKGAKNGITGYDGTNEYLNILNATVTAEGTEEGAIYRFARLNLTDCDITEPKGSYFSENGVRREGSLVKKVVISPVTNYKLWIAGNQVNSSNCGDLTEFNGVKGTVKYDPDSKTLMLKDATIIAVGETGINSSIDGLTIKVMGTNKLSSKYIGISVGKPTTITGTGTFDLEISGGMAIFMPTHLTIDGCKMGIKGGKYGILGFERVEDKLTIRNATVTVEGTEHGSIVFLGALNLEGCAITRPAGAVFDDSKHAVVLDGEIVTSEVKIEPVVTKYALYICGTQVTSGNCGDLSVIDGVEGAVSYNFSTKTLTLDNATIKNSSMYAAIDVDRPMDIEVKGVCKIKSDAPGIYLREPTRIYSERSTFDDQCLEVESSSEVTICMNKTPLIIDNCNVSAKNTYSKGMAISGEWADYESTLTIKGDYTRVTAEGKGGSICSIVKLSLDGCAVTQPKGAAFDASLQGIALNGELVKSKVVIEKTPSAIEHVTTDALAAKDGIFTVSGVKLNGEVEDLPKGIYIVNGKKVVKK